MSISVGIGNVDVRVEPLDGEAVGVRYIDTVMGELVEVETTLSGLAEWERIGGRPPGLIERRWSVAEMDAAIDTLRGRQAVIEAERDALVTRFPQLKSHRRP